MPKPTLILNADTLRPLRTAADDYKKTEAIKKEFAELRRTRSPFYLGEAEMEKVFEWKLATQYGRQAEARKVNTDANYRIITQAAFAVSSPDWKLDAKLRMNLLTCITGVGVPVASAILALTMPDQYCVIDFRGWRAAFGEDRRSFDISHYLTYLEAVRSLSVELGWCVQETDLAMWECDSKKHSKQGL